MILKELNITNYKNIEEAKIKCSPGVNCFVGNNGMGKTNILDAIYYLSFGKSYTNLNDAMTIRHDAGFMMLSAEYERKGEPVNVSVALQPGKRKTIRRDGKDYKRLSEHIGLLPVVMVSPMDWDLIRGAGEERRRLMDTVISQSSSEYLATLIRYNKTVEQRNSMIRQGYRDPLLYAAVEQMICAAAKFIHQSRKDWISEFSPIFMRYYQAIADNGEVVRLEYCSQLNQQSMEQLLEANRERDFAIGYTTKGTQRDDIELMLGDHSMRRTGSQGQCKTYTIALRLAQYEFLKTVSHVKPILLLDDIFDKLDSHRVENIIKVAAGSEFGQIFVTDTNREHIDEIINRIRGDYKLMNVDHGTISEIASNSTPS